MAWCLAVAVSQAPGLAGIPWVGHCSSAMTRASWASSSAIPTSPTSRANPATTRPDSMRHTASTARRVADCVAGSAASMPPIQPPPLRSREVLRSEHLQHVGLAFPAGPQVAVQAHEAGGPFDRLLLRADLV